MSVKVTVTIPVDVDSEVIRRVKSHFVDEFEGYTQTTVEGEWYDQEADEVVHDESVRVWSLVDERWKAEVVGKANARLVARNSDEKSVMWDIQEVSYGFEE